MIACHSMLHRACTLPSSKDSFNKEKPFHKANSRSEWLKTTTIDKLLINQTDKKKIRELTTLAPIDKETTRKLPTF
jgi:hypothetical protein